MRNVPLLEEVMTHIKDHPETHNQSMYLSQNECGTAGCFAGWAWLLSGREYLEIDSARDALRVFDGAQELLGLTDREAVALFSPVNSRSTLELMVKDLVNGDELRPEEYYHDDIVS